MNKNKEQIQLQVQVQELKHKLGLRNEFLRLQNEELLRCYAERERIEQQKQIFLQTLGHDLKNPLLGCILFLKSFLEQQEGSTLQVERRILELMLSSCQRQQKLIDSMQEASEITEVLPVMLNSLASKSCDVSEIVSNLLWEWSAVLASYQVEIDNQIKGDLLVVGEEVQLYRVFENLIGNAIKYNDRGLKINISAVEKGDKVLIRVADNGKGLPGSIKQYLFKPYCRGDNARLKTGFGYSFGLGLYIVKQIITRFGGEIGFTDVDCGASFWFTLLKA